MIQVWNLHSGSKQPWTGRGHYVGRPDPLGNPFKIGRDGTRAQVIEKYRVWLREVVKRHSENGAAGLAAWNRLRELKEIAVRGDLNLLCYCKPLPCHADVVKACLEWMIKSVNGGDKYDSKQPTD